jgi:hypothetical protein
MRERRNAVMPRSFVGIGGAVRGIAGMAPREQADGVRRNGQTVSWTASPFDWKEFNV